MIERAVFGHGLGAAPFACRIAGVGAVCARRGRGVARAVQHVREFCRETFANREFWLVCCAMGLAGLTVQLMNRSLFPLFDDVFTYARDISITCSSLVSIALGLISLARPAL